MCCNPVWVAKKNMYVPCGKCIECQTIKRAAWSFRAKEELKDRSQAFFITLTYSDDLIHDREYDFENLDKYNFNNNSNYCYQTLDKNDASIFLNLLQKWYRDKFGTYKYKVYTKTVNCKVYQNRIKYKTSPLVRYFLTGEYSPVGRPHYHAIIWLPNECSVKYSTKSFKNVLSNIWSYGHVDVRSVNRAAINYVGKHQVKQCTGNYYQNKFAPIFAKMSRYGGGIGRSYLTPALIQQQIINGRQHPMKVVNGSFTLPLPEFYRKKIFTEKLDDDQMREVQTNSVLKLMSTYYAWLSSNGFVNDVRMARRLAIQGDRLDVALDKINPDLSPVMFYDVKDRKWHYDKESVFWQFLHNTRQKDKDARQKFRKLNFTKHYIKTKTSLTYNL